MRRDPPAALARSGGLCCRLLLALAVLLVPAVLAAQGVANPLVSGGGGDAEGAGDREAFRESLENVIRTLEDAERREALLADLKELREATGPDETPAATGPGSGLLAAMSDAFTTLGEPAEAEERLRDTWRQRLARARDDAAAIVDAATYERGGRFASEAALLGGLWAAVAGVLVLAGRGLAHRRGWPLRLPDEAPAWLLLVHVLRRMLPWLLGFAVVLGALQLLPASPGRTAAVVLAYTVLCGRALAVVSELVLALFTRGHRRQAVALLRRHALPRLFLIGALVALADALGASRLEDLLGAGLASLLALIASGLATLQAGQCVLRFRRPVQHLVYNRPLPQRLSGTSTNEILRLISRYWHLPALTLVLASLAALVLAAGEPGEVLLRGVVCVALLIATVVATRLINHHAEQGLRASRRVSGYRRRLERFGYTVAHIASWTVFAELVLWVWGGSLFGLGEDTLGGRIGQALLAVAVTGLFAWLAWILADSTIQRALASTMEARGRRVNAARVQTITPMIRNVLFTTILVIAVIVGLANLGVNVTPLLAGAGIIGIAIGFGAQTLVQDLITGMFILVEDSLAIDDFVDLGGQMGQVEGLSLRTVRLRDLDGILHIIPFSQIQAIHNMSRQFGVALLRVQVPHGLAVDDARAILQEVAEEVRKDATLGRHVWAPLEFQGVEGFEQGAAVLRVRIRTAPVMQWDVAREFNLRLKRRLEQDGLDVATQRISLRMEGRGAESGDGSADTPPDATPAGGRSGPAPEG